MCEYKGYEIYDVYKDAGISAKTGNLRPEFERLLQDIRDKKVNTIVVLKLDRLTRSVYDMEGIMNFLEENSLELRVKTLDDKLKKKDDEIKELKEENNILKTSLENLQKLFDKLIKFLKDRMFNKKEKDKYYDFSVDLYTHGIINDKEIKDIKNNYDYLKEKDSKHKNDDFEL